MFRVAEFEMIGGRQVFERFAAKGYRIDNSGQLFKNHIKQNIEDKRRHNYREVNLYTRRTDINGNRIYAKDIIRYKPDRLIGFVEWNDRRAGFIVWLQRDFFKVPYVLLECQDRSVEVIGDLYTTPELLNNKLKRI